MSIEHSESLIRQLLLNLAETACNKVITEQGISLADMSGHVIRFRSYGPELNFYLVIDQEGVQILNHYDGPVAARVRAATSELARYIFGTQDDADALSVRIVGDRELVARLRKITANIDYWALVQQQLKDWLPDYETLGDILDALRIFDPAWLERLQHIPQSVAQVAGQLQQLAEIQQMQLQELRSIRLMLESQAQYQRLLFFIGIMTLIFGASLGAGVIEALPTIERLLFAAVFILLGVVLVLPLSMTISSASGESASSGQKEGNTGFSKPSGGGKKLGNGRLSGDP